MARKINEENERVKRTYLNYLREAKGLDLKTIDKVAEALLKFEQSTGYKSFKRFHIDQPKTFKAKLYDTKAARTGAPLSKSTISSILGANKAFMVWLAGQAGYKSRISYADAEYFNQLRNDANVAHAHRDPKYPTLAQCRHTFNLMPSSTVIEKRNKALFAFFMLTGARDGATASLTLKRIDLIEGCANQDARDVKTKNAKTFTTFFLPIDSAFLACFVEWVNFLRDDLLFGHDDPLFPPPELANVDGSFQVIGLAKRTYSDASAIRTVIKDSFADAGLFPFTPHSFRKTLTIWADKHYPSREAFKAYSQNVAHDSVVTTISSYCPVSRERQAELIRGG